MKNLKDWLIERAAKLLLKWTRVRVRRGDCRARLPRSCVRLPRKAAAAATPRLTHATALRFIPSCEGISAEVVEVLVQLCAMKQGHLDDPQLASVFDINSGGQATMNDLRNNLRMRIGPYEEDEPGVATTVEGCC